MHHIQKGNISWVIKILNAFKYTESKKLTLSWAPETKESESESHFVGSVEGGIR